MANKKISIETLLRIFATESQRMDFLCSQMQATVAIIEGAAKAGAVQETFEGMNQDAIALVEAITRSMNAHLRYVRIAQQLSDLVWVNTPLLTRSKQT